MRYGTRAAALLLVACGATACAPAAFLPYRPEQPFTVTLPLAQAGVADARSAYASLFDAELKAAGETRPAIWLHGAPSAALAAEPPAQLAARFASRAGATSVLVVGGLFGDCLGAQAVPFGDGVDRPAERSAIDSYRQYADLGLRSIRLVALPGRASSEANGRLLAQAIRAEAALPGVQRIVLVGYSKGVPDALQALEMLLNDGGLPGSLVALVSIAGAVMGTPLADYYQPAYDAVSPLVTPFDCTPSQGGDLASVTRRERIARLAAHPPPPGLAYYSIVAHAALDEMAPPLRVPARQLSVIDPRNDGQLIASDAVLPGSTLLAEVRADHWDVALPRDRGPSSWLREMTSGRGYPREALFRATLKWVVATAP
jgi:hypothetical protein